MALFKPNELETIFQKSSIFIFLNIDQSWGIAVFEALSRGLPVIISESAGCSELLKGKEGVITVDPIDYKNIAKQICYLSNKEVWKRYSEGAYKTVENMSWDEMYSSKVLDLANKLYKVEKSTSYLYQICQIQIL